MSHVTCLEGAAGAFASLRLLGCRHRFLHTPDIRGLLLLGDRTCGRCKFGVRFINLRIESTLASTTSGSSTKRVLVMRAPNLSHAPAGGLGAGAHVCSAEHSYPTLGSMHQSNAIRVLGVARVQKLAGPHILKPQGTNMIWFNNADPNIQTTLNVTTVR